MTQFIAHAEEMRTFADKKGATKAIKRDLNKHYDTHGENLFMTDFEVKEFGDSGRYGVLVLCDLTPDEAKSNVSDLLSGYVIEPQLKPEKPVKTETSNSSRRKGQVNVEPTSPLLACRAASKQQAIVNALAKDCVFDHEIEIVQEGKAHVALKGLTSKVGGASMSDLRKVCVRKDGTAWDDNSIRSALYYDIKDKGYGVRTLWDGDDSKEDARYVLVLPEGYDAPLPSKAPKS